MSYHTSLMPYAYFRKGIVPSVDASISIASQSLQYGTTCFGGIRGYVRDGKIRIFRLHDHFLRMKHAAKILGMEVQLAWEEFYTIIKDLVFSNHPQKDFYIRPFLFTEDQSLTPRFDGLDFDLAIYAMPLQQLF